MIVLSLKKGKDDNIAEKITIMACFYFTCTAFKQFADGNISQKNIWLVQNGEQIGKSTIYSTMIGHLFILMKNWGCF